MADDKGQPIVDYTTVAGVQSLFDSGLVDPWGRELVADLSDFLIYSKEVRYVQPVGDGEPAVPTLLSELSAGEPGFLRAQQYDASETMHLSEEMLAESFLLFCDWARNNPKNLRGWVNFQMQDWVRSIHFAGITPGHLFNVTRVSGFPEFRHLIDQASISYDGLLHAFDVYLRYPHYGRIAGEEYYLAHPIRTSPPLLPKTLSGTAEPPKVAVRFGPELAKVAHDFDQTQYVEVILELREQVHGSGLVNLKPGTVEAAVIRELAAEAQFKPRLRGRGRAVLLAVLGAVAAVPSIGLPIAATGAVLTASASIWEGSLPRRVSSWKWLRWALEWEVEKPPRDC